MNRTLLLHLAILTTALGLFSAACALPVGHGHGGFLEDGYDPVGLDLLFMGWVIAPVSWFANPLWMMAFICVCAGSSRTAAVLAAIGAALSLLPLVSLANGSVPEIRWHSPSALVFVGGHLELRLGYFAWVSSFVVLSLGASLLAYRQRHWQAIEGQQERAS
jgi:hypothetical protein